MSEIIVSSGATRTGLDVSQGDMLQVLPGGTVIRTNINLRGGASVEGRATSTTVNYGGRFIVSSGGAADYTRVNSAGRMTIFGSARFTSAFGNVVVSSGGMAYDTTVDSNGVFIVSSGGVASKTWVDDECELRIFSGGVASNTTVYARGSMSIFSGGTATGRMNFSDNAVVSAEEGAILDFDISGMDASENAFVNHLSVVQGAPTCTLTVSGTQADGTYTLADGAAGFNRTLTVRNTGGSELGTLTVGQTAKLGGVDYTLKLGGDDILTVTVSGSTPPPTPGDKLFFEGDFNGDLFDTLAVQKDSVVTIY